MTVFTENIRTPLIRLLSSSRKIPKSTSFTIPESASFNYLKLSSPISLLLTTSSQKIRTHSQIAKHKILASLNDITIICTLCFILIFSIGAHTSLHDSSFFMSKPSFLIKQTYPKTSVSRYEKSRMQQLLHDDHNIPFRFLNINHLQQVQLLEMINSNADKNIQIFFTAVMPCDKKNKCLDAINSIIAFAKVTERLVVLFVDDTEGFSKEIQLQRLGAGVLVVNMKDRKELNKLNDVSEEDWAELSVVHALTNNTQQKYGERDGEKPIMGKLPHRVDIEREKIINYVGNSNIRSTLDNIAMINTHIFLKTKRKISSKYISQHLQEGPSKNYTISKNIGDILHGHFKIPKILINTLDTISKNQLFQKLKMGQTNKILFVNAQYGLGNRLRVLISAILFAKMTNRLVVLNWVPDEHLNAKYSDLFIVPDDFVLSSYPFHNNSKWPFNIEFMDDKEVMNQVEWFTFMKHDQFNISTLSTFKNRIAEQHTNKTHMYISTCYTIPSKSKISKQLLRETYRKILIPHKNIMNQVSKTIYTYRMNKMIGVHIRSKSLSKDITSIANPGLTYGNESASVTNYWRNQTQVNSFITMLQKEDTHSLFYVAADSTVVVKELEREFPGRVISTGRECDGRDASCVMYAVVDLFILSECGEIRGSYWSSFTEVAACMGGRRFLLAGVDFGKPNNVETKKIADIGNRKMSSGGTIVHLK